MDENPMPVEEKEEMPVTPEAGAMPAEDGDMPEKPADEETAEGGETPAATI
ncbi:MAG: hypothetical protein AAB613_02205 [Patescibacteria group bacterium]